MATNLSRTVFGIPTIHKSGAYPAKRGLSNLEKLAPCDKYVWRERTIHSTFGELAAVRYSRLDKSGAKVLFDRVPYYTLQSLTLSGKVLTLQHSGSGYNTWECESEEAALALFKKATGLEDISL